MVEVLVMDEKKRKRKGQSRSSGVRERGDHKEGKNVCGVLERVEKNGVVVVMGKRGRKMG